MPITVNLSIADPDPAIPLTNLTNLVSVLRTLVSGILSQEISPIIKGDAIPTVDQQGYPWLRTVAGKPYALYTFTGGFWVMIPPDAGSRIACPFIGNPAPFFNGTGLGIPGPGPVALDYYGWALMNGMNGTANLSNRFVIAAQMGNLSIGYDGTWKTDVEGAPAASGGVSEITLVDGTTFRPAKAAVEADHYTVSGLTHDAGGLLYGIADGTNDFDLIAADAGQPTPDPIDVVNPYYAFALLQYLGI